MKWEFKVSNVKKGSFSEIGWGDPIFSSGILTFTKYYAMVEATSKWDIFY